MRRAIAEAVRAGVVYLAGRQFEDGRWEDYELPVGRSDAWVTGYVGLALARAGRRDLHPGAWDAAGRAADWLSRRRCYQAGWGYNGTTGPDSDSTGYALRLFREVGLPVRTEDESWLLARWQPDGGFATFEGPGGWGIAHPDVTPVAFRALSSSAQLRLLPALVRYLRRTRDADGTWPTYWWRARHYSTFLNSDLAIEVDAEFAPSLPAVSVEESRAIHSTFDLVFVAANASLHASAADLTRALTAELLNRQLADGSWEGGRNLRVTRHDAEDPWARPCGELYADHEHLITTASAVGVLAEFASACAPNM